MEEDFQHSHKQSLALSIHIQSAREDERRRIAREIHDELGQNLTALKIYLSQLLQELPRDQTLLIERTESLIKTMDGTFESVRKICSNLRPPEHDECGLLAALEWQVEDFQSCTQIICNFRPTIEEVPLNHDRSTAVYRIFKEALTNVARHARATKVKITLRGDAGSLLLEIEDNGRGITNNEIIAPKSLGLLGMRERALSLGGEVNITGVPGQGTKVTARIPCDG